MLPANLINRAKPMKLGRRNSLLQVLDIQQISQDVVRILRADVEKETDKKVRAQLASAIAQLGRSWCSLQDTKREILGKPRVGTGQTAMPRNGKHKPLDVFTIPEAKQIGPAEPVTQDAVPPEATPSPDPNPPIEPAGQ